MLVAAGRTGTGRVRGTNQDAFIVDPALQLQIVADGMGGHQGGGVAATIAAQTVHRFVRDSKEDGAITWPSGFRAGRSFAANQLANAICLAHRRIVAESRQVAGLQDMGSTVVAAVARGGTLTIVNVGDSRAYLLRAGTLAQVSVDHSWSADALRAGTDPAAVRADGRSHMLTQALGVRLDGEPPIFEVPLEDGDVLLLCSDGLHGGVDDARVGGVLASGAAVDAMADRLMTLADESGGRDNVTVVVSKYMAG